MSPVAHCLVRTSRSWVVEALVTSAPTAPVNHRLSRSGTRRSCSAAPSCGDPAAATTWYIVLNGRNCSPVVS
jgi:hypothetical protein